MAHIRSQSRIRETEHQIISAYQVRPRTRPADITRWVDCHQAIFAAPDDLAAGDCGFSSTVDEETASSRGVDESSCRAEAENRLRAAHMNGNGVGGNQSWRVRVRTQDPACSSE
jgi:hypothetical protein